MPSLRAASSGQGTNQISAIATTLPTGWQAGDFAICVVGMRNTTAPGTWTEPAGWSEDFTQQNTGDSNGAAVAVFSKVLDAGDTNPTFTHSDTGRWAWAMIAIKPDSGGTLSQDVAPAGSIVTASGSTKTPPSNVAVSSGVVSVLLQSLMAGGTGATAIDATPPTNWTEPASGDASTNSGTTNANRQIEAGVSYRLNQSGTITPGTLSTNVSTRGNLFHYLIAESAGSTPISLADAGTGTEAAAVSATIPLADAGVGAQTLTVSAAASVADSGVGTEQLSISVPVTLADSGTGADTLAAGITISLADSGVGTETASVAAAATLTETGTGTETPQVAAAVPISQTGTGTETVTVSAATTLTDTGSGADTLTAGITIPLSDAGAGAEDLTVLPIIALTDTAASTQIITVAALAALAETAAATDLLTIAAAAPLADTGAGLDTLTTMRPVALADSGTGNDTLDVFEGLPYDPVFIGVDGATTSSIVDHHAGAGTLDNSSRQPADLAGATTATQVDA